MSVDPFSMVAIGLGLAALVFAVRRQRADDQKRLANGAAYLTREQQLERRVATLERDIAGLQRMLTEKQAEIDRLTERIRQLESGTAPGGNPGATPAKQRRSVLAVAIGSDPMLEVDVAALRGISALQLSVLQGVTKADLEALLERHRANGFPVRYLHLAVHASHAGLQFADGLADGFWLSRNLSGVEVAVLAGCESDRVGDLLTVVPAVVSMRDEIDNRDASIFARAFWTAISQGQGVHAALEYALERSPSQVAEMVELRL